MKTHRLFVEVKAPDEMSGQTIADLLKFTVEAGMSEASESCDLDEEDQIGPVNDVLSLEVENFVPIPLQRSENPDSIDVLKLRYSIVGKYIDNQCNKSWQEMLSRITTLEGEPTVVLGKCTKVIKIDENNSITVEIDGKGAGTVMSTLRCFDLAEEDDEESDLIDSAVDGVESLVLAHACAGIDVSEERYADGVRTAVEAIANSA